MKNEEETNLRQADNPKKGESQKSAWRSVFRPKRKGRRAYAWRLKEIASAAYTWATNLKQLTIQEELAMRSRVSVSNASVGTLIYMVCSTRLRFVGISGNSTVITFALGLYLGSRIGLRNGLALGIGFQLGLGIDQGIEDSVAYSTAGVKCLSTGKNPKP